MPTEHFTAVGDVDARPADGERSAVVGFSGQYGLAARMLRAKITTLEWIRVADPSAGVADDFQFQAGGTRYALQVKWAQYPSTFGWAELVSSSKEATPLLGRLAQAWQGIRGNWSGPLEIRLWSNENPSATTPQRKSVLASCLAGAPRHFAAFLARSWVPVRERLRDGGATWSPIAMLPEVTDWQPAWDALRLAAGLEVDTFAAFVGDLNFHFGPGVDDRLLRPDEAPWDDDLEHLAATLQALVADPSRPVELTREALFERLGWNTRLRFHNLHTFPVPAVYTANEAARQQMQARLNCLGGGYVALVGPAGAGKSTLLASLTWPQRRVVRYYAFAPDASDPLSGRGEADSFLHDVSLALEGVGFRRRGYGNDLRTQRAILREQFADAGERWRNTGEVTVVVVDGLDHIPREQNPSRSLLEELPAPAGLPQGVFVVLGTQMAGILPRPIRDALTIEGRTVELPPLAPDEVLRLADASGPGGWLLPCQRDRLVAASKGHPRQLCARHGLAAPNPQSRPLSSIFDLALPPLPARAAPEPDTRGVPMIDIHDPQQLLQPFDVPLRICARAAGLPEEAVLHRASAIAAGLDMPWLRGGHQAHATRLTTRGQHHTYRPWAYMAGRRALGIVLAELVDAGALDPARAAEPSFTLELIDEVLVHVVPAPLDDTTPAPWRAPTDASYDVRGWCKQTEEAAQSYPTATEVSSTYVLAECTEWAQLEWGKPAERRTIRAAHGLAEAGGVTLPPRQLWERSLTSANRYPELQGLAWVDEQLIVEGWEMHSDPPWYRWLALHPAVARRLHWTADRTEPFCWNGDDGGWRARSIHRARGQLSYQPHAHAYCAEGWQVVVSGTGLAALRQAFGPLRRGLVVERTLPARPRDDRPAAESGRYGVSLTEPPWSGWSEPHSAAACRQAAAANSGRNYPPVPRCLAYRAVSSEGSPQCPPEPAPLSGRDARPWSRPGRFMRRSRGRRGVASRTRPRSQPLAGQRPCARCSFGPSSSCRPSGSCLGPSRSARPQ